LATISAIWRLRAGTSPSSTIVSKRPRRMRWSTGVATVTVGALVDVLVGLAGGADVVEPAPVVLDEPVDREVADDLLAERPPRSCRRQRRRFRRRGASTRKTQFVATADYFTTNEPSAGWK
jgi:hypothetical protein